MKSTLLFLAVATTVICFSAQSGFGVPDPSAPKRFAERAANSDRVMFYSYVDKKEITVVDRHWIDQLSNILADALYERVESPLAVTAPVTCFDKKGKKLFSFMILPGGILSTDDGIFRVGNKTCESIAELLKRKVG